MDRSSSPRSKIFNRPFDTASGLLRAGKGAKNAKNTGGNTQCRAIYSTPLYTNIEIYLNELGCFDGDL